jgi:hypothetical protein
VAVAEHPGLFGAQGEDLLDQRAVVPLGLAVAVVDLGGAGGVGAVEGFAQRAAVGVLHHRQVGGHLEAELPALYTGLLGGFAGGGDHVGGQAGQLGLDGDDVGVGVGGVEDVLGELGAEAGHFFLDGLEAGLLIVGQLGAREAEAAQLVFDDPLARRAEAGEGGAVAD